MPTAFAELLRRHRTARGLSQEELAERAGLSLSAISLLERGARRRPHPDTVERLALALGLSAPERASLSAAVRRAVSHRAAAAATPVKLPVQPTSFIGRDEAIAELCRLLLDPATRVLTLTGPPGVGKTRLVIEVARQLVPRFPDGVFFVPLDVLTDPAHVASAIAHTLDLPLLSGDSLAQTMCRHLGERDLLLVLDNFEHVLESAPLVGELVATCPWLTLLVTSRAILRLSAEQVYEVLPLPVPDPRQLPAPAELRRYDAVALFCDRARRVRSDFAVTPENGATIAEICRRLEGLPLAIELAAARIRLFPLTVLLRQLDDRLGTLTGGARDQPARQQTLRQAIRWSYELLEPDERTFFHRMAVFQGGCSLAAAEAVCEGRGVDNVIGLLEALLDRSLIHQDAIDGEARFALLETIRAFAREHLEGSGEANDIARAHAIYYSNWLVDPRAIHAGQELDLPFPVVERERENLRAALSWLIGAGEVELALRLAGGQWGLWFTNGPASEGRDWLRRVLALPGADRPTAGRAAALFAAGALASAPRDGDTRLAYLQEGMTLARTLGDRPGEGNLLRALGHCFAEQGDLARASGFYEQALGVARQERQDRYVCRDLWYCGLTSLLRGDDEAARRLFEEGARLPTWFRAQCLSALGHLAVQAGEVGRAEELLRKAAVIYRETGGTRGWTQVLVYLAELAWARREPERAARLLGAATAARERSGVVPEAGAAGLVIRQLIEALRGRLGGPEFDPPWSAGRAMALEDAWASALAWQERRPM